MLFSGLELNKNKNKHVASWLVWERAKQNNIFVSAFEGLKLLKFRSESSRFRRVPSLSFSIKIWNIQRPAGGRCCHGDAENQYGWSRVRRPCQGSLLWNAFHDPHLQRDCFIWTESLIIVFKNELLWNIAFVAALPLRNRNQRNQIKQQTHMRPNENRNLRYGFICLWCSLATSTVWCPEKLAGSFHELFYA